MTTQGYVPNNIALARGVPSFEHDRCSRTGAKIGLLKALRLGLTCFKRKKIRPCRDRLTHNEFVEPSVPVFWPQFDYAGDCPHRTQQMRSSRCEKAWFAYVSSRFGTEVTTYGGNQTIGGNQAIACDPKHTIARRCFVIPRCSSRIEQKTC